MVEEKEITREEFEQLRNTTGVVAAEYDDQPDAVAEKFVNELRRMGFKVEILCPPVDVPTILYRIHIPKE